PGTGVRAEAVFTRGLALSLQGKGAEARRAWESIAGDTDDLYGTKAAYYRAESLYEAGETAAAQKAVESLTDSATPHTYWLARAFILLSDIHAARGNKFEAREYLRSLRSNYPGDEPDIRRMIETRLEKLK
ncbi:MAG: tetratricopeptide repeat protein, partial [Bacteroides sp.]|nr:tetratricopeptide repeat protein [Bacteroides sp.]